MMTAVNILFYYYSMIMLNQLLSLLCKHTVIAYGVHSVMVSDAVCLLAFLAIILQGGPEIVPFYYCNNFVYSQPIFIIFGTYTVYTIGNL